LATESTSIDTTVAGTSSRLAIVQLAIMSVFFVDAHLVAAHDGVLALAGAANTATPARPTTAPARTAEVRRSFVLSRFTPTPEMGLLGKFERACRSW
jgi:hypothetical protein